MSSTPEKPPGSPTTNIYDDATLQPHASAPASVPDRAPARAAAHTPPKSQSQQADEKRAEAQRGGRPLPPSRQDPAPQAPPAAPANPSAQSAAKKREDRTPYDPAKAARDRNNQQSPPPPPPMTLQQRMAASRPHLRPEKKPLPKDEE